MSGHASTVDDPEKHFLGNLLEEDTSHNPPPLSAGSSSSLGAIPPVSVISSVGPISTSSLLRSYWPEPPPPYSPPIQNPFNTSWYSEPQTYAKPVSSDFFFNSNVEKLRFCLDTIDTSTHINMQGQPTIIAQPQIHHHHHNLHHHTHTHNVVENHHHYPITTITLPSQAYSVNTASERLSGISTVVHNDEDHNVLGTSAKKFFAPKVETKERAAQATEAVSSKLPLSYRDVAARTDQIVGGEGIPHVQAKKLHSHLDTENRSVLPRPREVSNTESSKVGKSRGERRAKCEQPVEFQKIMRKKVVSKKDKNELCESTSLPIVGHAAAVDAPTKYEVLQKLTSKTASGISRAESGLVAKREREPMRAAMVSERSRSSSVYPVRPKRVVDGMERKKQLNSASSGQPQQKKRTIRKRNESWWMDRIVVGISLLSFWIELGFKWILNLVVDVCLQVYDVTSFSIAYFLEWTQSSARRLLLIMNTAMFSCASSLRQIDIRRLVRFREPEPIMWGLEENITLPTTGEEALERFLGSPMCQDAYGVLGLRASCTEEDVRRHYKKLSALLNPDKNPLEGAEEAYEMVSKAYQVLSTPESRKAYNFNRIRPCRNDVHHELGELWDRIRERVEEARNSMYCDCGRRHARIALDIRQSEARYCRRCRIRHPARANDIWVETRLCGLLWVYFTCCDGIVYDITDWATCEVNYLKHVRPNSHTVQYRLVSPTAPSSGRSLGRESSSHHQNDRMREPSDVSDEFRPGRPGHAQISYLPLEPRDEDRSRRAANRRQKKWR